MPRKSLTLICSLALTGCAVGPDYKRPEVATPPAFKEVGDWKPADPKTVPIHTTWWDTFDDPILNELETQIDAANQNLRIAEAQYRQARALVTSARAPFFPTIDVQGAATRSQLGAQVGSGTAAAPVTVNRTQTSYSASVDANWELDVWGRIRRSTESARATAQATATDLAGVRLSLQSELATDYFSLRIVDSGKQLLERTVAAYEESLRLTQNRY